MEKRAIGTETEFAFALTTKNDEWGEFSYKLIDKLKPFGIRPTIISKARELWLVNGGKAYTDQGSPEFSTAECLYLDDLVVQEQVQTSLAQYAADKLKVDEEVDSWLFAMSFKGRDQGFVNTLGYHVNISLRGEGKPAQGWFGIHFKKNTPPERTTNVKEFRKGLYPLLATIPMISGSGIFLPERLQEINGCEFALSPRALEVGRLRDGINLKVAYNRGVIEKSENRKDVLHIASLDRNISPLVTKLKNGILRMCVQMVDEGWRPKLSYQTTDEYVANFHRISQAQEDWKYLLDGTAVDAIDIQRLYLAAAEKRFSKKEPDNEWVLDQWSKVLDQLEKDPRKVHNLDWVRKLNLAEKYKIKRSDDKLKFDLSYHITDPKHSINVIEYGSQTPDVVSGDTLTPPQGTRALGRGYIVSRVLDSMKRSTGDRPIFYIDWHRISGDSLDLRMTDVTNTYILDAQRQAAKAFVF